MLLISPGDPGLKQGYYDFSEHLSILIDSVEGTRVEDVAYGSLKTRFVKDSTGMLNRWAADMGPEIRYIWARLRIYSTLDKEQEWLLSMNAKEVDMFVETDSGRFYAHRTGFIFDLKDRQVGDSYGTLPVFRLRIPAGDTVSVYFRLKGVTAMLLNNLFPKFHMHLFKPEAYSSFDRSSRFYTALIFGILLAVGFYHLIIYLYQRKKGSLYFSLFVLLYTVVISMYSSYFQEFLFPNSVLDYGVAMVAVVLPFVYYFHYLFSRDYLKLPEILPFWDRVWFGLVVLFALSSVIMIVMILSAGNLTYVNQKAFMGQTLLKGWAIFGIQILSLAAAIFARVRGNKAAGIYIIAMLAFIAQDIFNFLPFFELVHPPHPLMGFWGHTLMVILFALGIARQIKQLETDRSAAQQARIQTESEFAKTRELSEFKTRFFTNITHQFRTPLTVIMGMASQIRAHPSTWTEKGVEMINRNARRLLHLVNQVLDISKLDSGLMRVNLVRGDVIPYIKYLIESFHSLAEQKNIRIRFSPDPESLELDFDPDKLTDILSNLIANAVKFTPEFGSVDIEVTLPPGEETQWQIEVRDNGRGIPESDLPHIFDRFFQSRQFQGDEQMGSGIGLALTRDLVHLMGGTIQVESKLGEGSRFRIRLPVSRRADLAEAFSPDQITEMVPADIYKENGFRLPDSLKKGPNQNVILVVEDNRDVAAYLESVLSGFEVRVCYNGREGLEMAQNIIPDMIVCDIMMPEMDGLALCRILKADKRTNHIPVILLTAKADTASRMEGLEAGADAYLTKPFRREEILLRIGKMIELRQKMQERYRDLAFLFQAETVASPKGNTAEDQFLREVHQIIETHLSDPDLNVEAICRELGMGRTQLFQKFKALTGQTISDFIRKTRLYKARHLLKNTSLNVSEVAGEVGFRSLSTFSRNYRAEFGMNPSEVKNGG